ncbi:hypothetical protein FACS18945_5580 [Bacteroidia bacterium]|nr:hypothetical protein FACS18945_5580 [Bacteroidia bacterium]
MREYSAHFSCYSEENGNFDTIRLGLQAADQFEARRLAWDVFDNSDGSKFMSCVNLCGVTWTASPLDIQDYFNSLAASDRCRIKEIENSDFPNDDIARHKERSPEPDIQANETKARHQSDRAACFGSLDAISAIARDCCKPLGIAPPGAYEDIYYAKEFAKYLDERGYNNTAWALTTRAELAEKWDDGAIFSLRMMFQERGAQIDGEYLTLNDEFARNGVYPEHGVTGEPSYEFVNRWRRAPYVPELSVLPQYDSRHIIIGSEDMTFEYRTLVLRRDALNAEYQTPENLLWTPCERDAEDIGNEIGRDPGTVFRAENLVTGEVNEWRRDDFYGVLRPEFCDNIKFDALKKEYAASRVDEIETEDEDENESGNEYDNENDENEDEGDWEDEL